MKIVSVAMQKGGVGKSTLVRSLAVAAADAGLNVLVLDLDVQQSVSLWRARRTAVLPVVNATTAADLPRDLHHARQSGCDLVLIDTPPVRHTDAPAAIEYSDIVLVPCTPDIECYEQLPRTLRLAHTTGTPVGVVLSMATPNSQSEKDIARAVMRTIGGVEMVGVLHRFKVHRAASHKGLSAAELEPGGKAAAEIAQLWDWLRMELKKDEKASRRWVSDARQG